ncbi:MAG TPA: hypothetical protein VEJ36_01020 [Nitrososphaerales archaeon]|nr:hypothetical protein [Nitrososphaerales archaeon]
MARDRRDDEMKCPKCGRFDLHTTSSGVGCKTCGYELTPGEVDKYRLFKLLKEEGKGGQPRL